MFEFFCEKVIFGDKFYGLFVVKFMSVVFLEWKF